MSLPAIPSSAPLHVPRIKSMFDGHVTTTTGRVYILLQTKRNQWARIRVAIPEHETEGPRAILTGELVEIIGPGKSPPPAQAPRAHARTSAAAETCSAVGEFESELKAYQLHFGLLPCRYPAPDSWGLLPAVDES